MGSYGLSDVSMLKIPTGACIKTLIRRTGLLWAVDAMNPLSIPDISYID